MNVGTVVMLSGKYVLEWLNAIQLTVQLSHVQLKTQRCRNWEVVFPAVMTGIVSVITPSIISLPLCNHSLSEKDEIGSLVKHKLFMGFHSVFTDFV